MSLVQHRHLPARVLGRRKDVEDGIDDHPDQHASGFDNDPLGPPTHLLRGQAKKPAQIDDGYDLLTVVGDSEDEGTLARQLDEWKRVDDLTDARATSSAYKTVSTSTRIKSFASVVLYALPPLTSFPQQRHGVDQNQHVFPVA